MKIRNTVLAVAVMMIASVCAFGQIDCNAHVYDPSGVLGNKTADVEKIATKYSSGGLTFRILVVDTLSQYPSPEEGTKQLLSTCPEWNNGTGGVKSDEVVIVRAIADKRLYTWPGANFADTLTQDEMKRVREEVMKPYVSTGDLATGLEKGISNMQATVYVGYAWFQFFLGFFLFLLAGCGLLWVVYRVKARNAKHKAQDKARQAYAVVVTAVASLLQEVGPLHDKLMGFLRQQVKSFSGAEMQALIGELASITATYNAANAAYVELSNNLETPNAYDQENLRSTDEYDEAKKKFVAIQQQLTLASTAYGTFDKKIHRRVDMVSDALQQILKTAETVQAYKQRSEQLAGTDTATLDQLHQAACGLITQAQGHFELRDFEKGSVALVELEKAVEVYTAAVSATEKAVSVDADYGQRVLRSFNTSRLNVVRAEEYINTHAADCSEGPGFHLRAAKAALATAHNIFSQTKPDHHLGSLELEKLDSSILAAMKAATEDVRTAEFTRAEITRLTTEAAHAVEQARVIISNFADDGGKKAKQFYLEAEKYANAAGALGISEADVLTNLRKAKENANSAILHANKEVLPKQRYTASGGGSRGGSGRRPSGGNGNMLLAEARVAAQATRGIRIPAQSLNPAE